MRPLNPLYKKILIINPFGIGDVLFTTPIVHSLKESCPDASIGYLCNRRTAEILKNNPFIDRVFVYERDEFEKLRRKSFFAWLGAIATLVNQIRKERFDLVFDFSLNTQYGFFSWLSGIRERIGYDFKERGNFLTKKIPLAGYSQKHIVDYYADLLGLAGLKLKYRNLELYLKDEDSRRMEEVLAQAGVKGAKALVGIIPGAGRSWGKDAFLKHWAAKNFAALADKIVDNYNAKIIIMGDLSESAIAAAVSGAMRNSAVNLSGKTTLAELAALILRMDLVVTNDGGPLHMAVALGVKSVSVFGPVDERVYGPYPADAKKHIVLKTDLACRPCYRNFRLSPCSNKRQCLEGINVARAFEAVSALLK